MQKSTIKVRTLNGYRVIHRPGHWSAMTSENWNGWVYEHIFIAEKYLGRKLHADEVVHHLDGRRDNNKIQNLLVILRSQHVKLHVWLERSTASIHGAAEQVLDIKYCQCCGITLQDDQTISCSYKCGGLLTRRCARPSADELKQLMSNLSMVKIGAMFGVSDNAVRKWAKSFGLIARA